MTVTLPKDVPTTLTDLLFSRLQDSSSTCIGFLDATGGLTKTLSYPELYQNARHDALRLLAAGLKPGKDIVVTSFPDHESHIRLFWACCFGMSMFSTSVNALLIHARSRNPCVPHPTPTS